MIMARINITEKTNKLLNIVKEEFGLKNKSQAIDLVARWYEKKLKQS